MFKKILKYALIGIFTGVFFLASGVLMVFMNHDGNLEDNKVYDYGVVLGAAIRSRKRPSATLKSRLLVAIQLYKEGTVKKLLFSGAKVNMIKPGEPRVMRHFAIQHGVSPDDIELDEAGDNTMLTVVNTRRLLKGKSKVFISSFFHLTRIRMTAAIMGLDKFAVYPSEGNHPKVVYFVFRESVAIWYYLAKSLLLRIF